MKPEYIIVHHSVSKKDTTIEELDAWHKTRWPLFKSSKGYYIGYHFVITGNGVITQTREDNEVGAHAKDGSMNLKSIGICLTGNFETEKPNAIQLESLAKLIGMLRDKYPGLKVMGHNQIPAQTACPGRGLVEWLSKFNEQPNSNKKVKELLEEALKILNGNS